MPRVGLRAPARRSRVPAGVAMSRAVLYLRVSTREQTTENQEHELQRWAERLGFELIRQYAETASGSRTDRRSLSELLAAAHRREFDCF